MRWMGFLAALIGLLLSGCNIETNSTEPEPTIMPTPQGPLVVSTSSKVIVESWEYISPRLEKALQSFPSQDPEAIKFGPENYEAYVLWREGGFDLIWGDVICSTQPVLIIEEATIGLWPNDVIWDDCEAAETIHAFKVELETNIPPEAWTYTIHPGAPPEDIHR